MNPLIGMGLGGIIESVGKVADDLITSDEERMKIALQERELDQQLLTAQTKINEVEATHPSVFVAGWRPAIGWIGAAALAYQYLLYPLLVWGWSLLQAQGVVPAEQAPPPVIDPEALWVLLTGMLGIAGLRSFDKAKETATDRVVR